MTELAGIPGYFNVTREEGKMLMQPIVTIDGYYLLRPTDDPTAVCTICVSNKQKLMNYKLMQESQTRLYFVRDRKFPTISALIQHYHQFPLNPDVKTRLLYPVTGDQGDEYVALEPARDPPPSVHTRTAPSYPNSNLPPALPDRSRPKSSNDRMRCPLPPEPTPSPQKQQLPYQRNGSLEKQSSNAEIIENLPGVHVDLTKNQVPIILAAFTDRDSSYLVRPSVSSKGQYTISLTCENSILNFKINRDPSDKKYFVTPKKKFNTVKELLDTHRSFPLKSKARAGAKIYLLHPITKADIQMVLELIKQKQESQLSAPPILEPIPPPWREYFDKNHNRPYYYNPESKVTLWERPKGDLSMQKNFQKSSTMDNRGSRPLPNAPENSLNTHRLSLDSGMVSRPSLSMSPRVSKRGRDQRALPDLPSKSPSSTRRESSKYTQDQLPQLPPKDIPSTSQLQRGSVPNLPPKHQQEHRQSLPLPSRDDSLPPLPSKDVPPLPNKVPALPKKDPISPNHVPQLPPKELPSSGHNGYNPSNASLPPLPHKDSSPSSITPTISLPPLPPKDSSDNTPPPQNSSSVPPRSRREYEETIILTPNTKRAVVNAPLPPPINMSTNTPQPPPVPSQGGPPPPPPAPPIPPEGIPGPPPPPAIIPSPSLNIQRKSNPPPVQQESAAGGRPFSANDLLQQRNRLKAKKDEDIEPKHKSGNFLEDTLSNAIELRLGSIRNAMDDSDEDTDVEEVDDDDDWD